MENAPRENPLQEEVRFLARCDGLRPRLHSLTSGEPPTSSHEAFGLVLLTGLPGRLKPFHSKLGISQRSCLSSPWEAVADASREVVRLAVEVGGCLRNIVTLEQRPYIPPLYIASPRPKDVSTQVIAYESVGCADIAAGLASLNVALYLGVLWSCVLNDVRVRFAIGGRGGVVHLFRSSSPLSSARSDAVSKVASMSLSASASLSTTSLGVSSDVQPAVRASPKSESRERTKSVRIGFSGALGGLCALMTDGHECMGQWV